MERELDELLRYALAPTEKADSVLNQEILNQMKEEKGMGKKAERNAKRRNPAMNGGTGRRLIPAAAVMAALLAAGSLTVYGAWRFLSPDRVADETGDAELAKAFAAGNAVSVNETQSFGGYDVTLIGVVSGEGLSEYMRSSGGEVLEDRTYAVAAIGHSDGTPMPDTAGDAYGEQAFFASPLIGGYDPAYYNAASMHGNYTELWSDGIWYRVVECDNVEPFADHALYFCISDGTFYNTEAYCYDKETGVISRNEEYDGVNALFSLPIDASKADPGKAAACLAEWGIQENNISEEKLKLNPDDIAAVEIEQGNEKGAGAAEYALSFVGNPYEWNGESLTEGVDSSGFTMKVYEQSGMELPHSSKGQRELGKEVDTLENAQPGDLVFYEEPAHVGIYIGGGKIVHAYPQIGICVSEADFARIAEIRRIFWEE